MPDGAVPIQHFTCLCSDAGRSGRLTVTGELDLSTVRTFERALTRATATAGGRMVVVRGPASLERLLRIEGFETSLELVNLDREPQEPPHVRTELAGS